MSQQIEEQFNTIGQQMISRAERVKCDFGDFVAGLRSMKSEIEMRLMGAEEELENMNEEDEG